MRALTLLAQVELGETDRAEAALAGLDEHERQSAQMRTALASLRLAQHDPHAAAAALAPVLDGSVIRIGVQPSWVVIALLLEATARDALGAPDAAGHALERALDIAEPDRVLVPFLLHLAPGLLERHARHATAHAALIADILSLLREANGGLVPLPCTGGTWGRSISPRQDCASRSARPRPTCCATYPLACPW
jgi:LuxR family maltose regulon positive regulatory protein